MAFITFCLDTAWEMLQICFQEHYEFGDLFSGHKIFNSKSLDLRLRLIIMTDECRWAEWLISWTDAHVGVDTVAGGCGEGEVNGVETKWKQSSGSSCRSVICTRCRQMWAWWGEAGDWVGCGDLSVGRLHRISFVSRETSQWNEGSKEWSYRRGVFSSQPLENRSPGRGTSKMGPGLLVDKDA